MNHDFIVNIVSHSIDSDTRIWNSLIDINDEPTKIIKKSVGNFLMINNELYVLTCYHGIKNSSRLDVEYFKNNKKKKIYEAICVAKSIIWDLALLKIENNNNSNVNINCIPLELFNNKIGDGMITIYLKQYNNKKNVINKQLIKLNISSISFEKMNSFHQPLMPYIECSTNKLSFDEVKNMSGLSGSLVYKNNTITGMFMNYVRNKDCIQILPSAMINRFISEYEHTNEFNGLCSLVDKTVCYEIEHNKENMIVHIVKETFGVNYNDNILSKTNKYGNKIKKNDIIYKINNIKFNNKGKIYDKETGLFLNIDTYISINFKNDDFIPIEIFRENKNKEFETKKINIKARPLSTIKNINIINEDKFIDINGLIFTEMSEDIIEFYNNHGIKISGKLIDYYTKNPYCNNNSKIIGLVNYNKNNNKIDNTTKILPLVNDSNANNYYVPILESINKTKIIDKFNINDLINYVKNQNNIINELKLLLTDNKKLKISINDDNIIIKKVMTKKT